MAVARITMLLIWRRKLFTELPVPYHLVCGETAGLHELRAQMVAPTSSLLLLLLVGQRSLHSARGIFTVGKLLHIIVNLLLCPALLRVVVEGVAAMIKERALPRILAGQDPTWH
ncbi:hypothetical protein KC19_5G143900 [Ceratodon purpureus]|uniref:Uncharacterized protein n=1 Tax=Ceratodon purpureus TaxID=3225 RepID=A0A8T0I3U6_CERPU|nr:hypothetical protein KC19_5G143900 [Ceratodon purpureus]